jgi:hypothetical protein
MMVHQNKEKLDEHKQAKRNFLIDILTKNQLTSNCVHAPILLLSLVR